MRPVLTASESHKHPGSVTIYNFALLVTQKQGKENKAIWREVWAASLRAGILRRRSRPRGSGAVGSLPGHPPAGARGAKGSVL